MKHHIKIFYSTIFLLGAILFISCKKDNESPENPQTNQNDEEVITSLQVVFTDLNSGGASFTATFRDPDGPGGSGPDIFDTIRINSSTSYQVELLFLNETLNPVDTVSHEVAEEAAEHIVCFESSSPELSIQRTDTDGQYELGLQSLWTTSNSATGEVTITLKHQPGVKDGTCGPGETDVQVTFPLIID